MAFTLTFPDNIDLNVSLQVGDLIYATGVTAVGGFPTSDTSLTQLLGPCSDISGNIITVDPEAPGSTAPVIGSFIMFTKDNTANLSGVRGYFAEVELRNNSTQDAELYAVTMDVTESSK